MEIEKKSTIDEALLQLLDKYGIQASFGFQLANEAVNNEKLKLSPGWKLMETPLSPEQVPLLTWRVKRPFVELRNIVSNQVIEQVRLLRYCAFRSSDWSLKSLLYREFDLVEFITGQKIISVNAVLSDDKAGNIIACLEDGAISSIEVSVQLPKSAPIQERHEIISPRGTASDLLVDAQIPQNSIYSYVEGNEQHFKDYDMELFEYKDYEIDHIRAAFEVISCPYLIEEWSSQHLHLVNLIEHALLSEKNRKKVSIT